ncbi:MAG: class I SAM-dependent methyltransferase [Acetobacteraceae bacterium]|nr:class I SAM-dependent methyltransferase [Acetobacteraceae bacterium]
MVAGVEEHYTSAGIVTRVVSAVRAAYGPDVQITPEILSVLDHFHGRGIVATREMVALLKPQAGEHILDIGCGIGGPARWIAATFGCHVTGVDLTRAFCEAAIELNVLTGMSERVRILHGSALALPVPDRSFDRAYSQNVVMNIPNKREMYREALRVLKPGGALALSNLCSGANGDPYFPVPWAATPATSFLCSAEQTRADLLAEGFEILQFHDRTQQALAETIKYRQRLESAGSPALGVHLILGERMREYQINSSRSLEDGRTTVVEVLAKRPD